ncbi:MAG: BolA family protein [Candidatus Competibacteraceae bacterium]|jgi:BolA protein|nr:BolA family protein [Candidatus Competibacteraceae bacterium]
MNDRVALIEQRLRAALAPTELEIIDDSAAHAGHAGARSGGGHFNVLIVSPLFDGKPLLQRHRLVYQAVDDLMKQEIHALSIKALTPAEL